MTISMPNYPNFKASSFTIQTNTQSYTSPITKNTQRSLLGGALWQASYTLPKMNRPQMAAWQAFFLACQGSFNTFFGFDPDAKKPRGPATGVPLVTGANQTGTALNIDGCTASINGWLLPGDYFNVNGELKMITAPVNTDGSGAATLNFQPPLRSSPADNTAIITNNPTCLMILKDDSQATWQTDANGIYAEKTFAAMEVFS